MIPKINLIYYKNILDNVLTRFVNDTSDFFTRENNKYVFSKSISKKRLSSILEEYIKDEILKLVLKYDVSNPNYYFVIGSCFPNNNILLRFISNKDKLQKFQNKLESKYKDIKYLLKETDIIMDFEMLNFIFEDIFTKFFKRKTFQKIFGKEYYNLFFIRHDQLDCYSMYRMIKDIYGRINTINLHKANKEKMSENLVSINELIGKKVTRKKEICRGKETEFIRKEIRQYVENCIMGKLNGKE